MSDQCPVLPRLEALPFNIDRTSAWRAVLAVGDVAMSDEGNFFVIGAAEVEAASKDYETFSSEGAFGILGSPFPLVPIAVDPPAHSRYRRMLNKFFGPREIAAHKAEFRAQLDLLIDAIVANGPSCDLVSALAVPFPSRAFLTLFGLPLSDCDRLIGWKSAIVQLANTQGAQTNPDIVVAAGELARYLSDNIKHRRVSGGDDLLSELIADRDDGALTDAELLGMCFIFILAGLDTVTAATGFVLRALAQDPDLRRRVRHDPAAAAVLIEEVLRLECPIPAVPRLTTTEVTINGVTIPAGSNCWLMMGAASRDGRRYSEPDSVGSQRRSSFAFGRGPHRCVGSHLALLELQLIVERWLDRIPEFHLIDDPEALWPSATLTLRRLDVHLDTVLPAGSA